MCLVSLETIGQESSMLCIEVVQKDLIKRFLLTVCKNRASIDMFNFFRVKRTEMDVIDNNVVISFAITDSILKKRSDDGLEKMNGIRDYAINMDSVMSIKPCKFANAITSSVWDEVIEEIEAEENNMMELHHWQP